jgi:hypothetical protein
VLECLDRAAANLLEIDAPKDPAVAIAEALEMLPDKGPSVFSSYRKSKKQFRYADAVLNLMEKGHKQTEAIAAVAKKNPVSVSTINRAFQLLCQSVPGDCET